MTEPGDRAAEMEAIRQPEHTSPGDGPRPHAIRRLKSEFIRLVVFPIFDRRWRPSTQQYLKELRQFEFASLEAVQQVQWQKLKAIVGHAARNVPYYRNLFRQGGLQPADIRSFEDFRRVPILAKSTLQLKLKELIAENRRPEEGLSNASGGSTGKPVQFYQDAEYWDRSVASERFVETW